MSDVNDNNITKKNDISENKKKQKNLKKDIRDIIITVVVAALIAFCLNTFVFQLVEVKMTSMVPTLMPEETVFLNKTAYWFSKPKSGDIVIFIRTDDDGNQIPDKSGKTVNYVKRIIGIPGDIIEIHDGKVYRNGTLLDEPYLQVVTNGDFYCEVPEGRYYVMGDNRNTSLDSKDSEFGLAKEDDILGRVEFKFKLFSKILKYNHSYADKKID